ncbi:28S ribosomal protein S18b, mitochondrial [Pleuronectes platessa]|uniref:28S ribosomal protein S18b, mitochondrial n=1 Tax=Pleuronectes platessa TaxID=8262 RepID=UPI00232A3311|nr:28S ribosomal protein S18b, mitochondrial [Pleuronectes platessa]XP_053302847.1 28S ribosomal protein S18b, mitochondrial [Pleuronectes platessa]
MATAIQRVAKDLCSLSPSIFHPLRQIQRLSRRLGPSPYLPHSHFFCKAASPQNEDSTQAAEALSRYNDRPWDYLESEEYIERYGASPVWEGYRRNHKGGIPPQTTRKTCIRGDKICGNPCPICRDPNTVIHHQNVKLLQQFISPHSGIVYDSTQTGLCMKQQKKLNEAISTAQDLGLLRFQIPYVKFTGEDFYSSHDAVGSTPPHPSLNSGDTWYKWYSEIIPDGKEVAKVKKAYKAYLK